LGIGKPEPGQLPDEQIPGLLDKLRSVMQDPEVANDPSFREYLIKKARRDYNMMWAQQQHARQAVKANQADVDEKILRDLQPRMQPGHPNPVREEELFDPRMSSEAQRTAYGFYQRMVKPDPASHLSAQTMRELYTKQQNGTLKGEAEINNAYIWGYLTEPDHKKAVAQYEKSQGDREKDWDKGFNDALKVIEPRIFPALTYPSMSRERANLFDATGAERVLRWKQAVEAKKDQLRKEGKNPMVLLQVPTEDRPNPDYIGNEGFWKGAAGEPPKEIYGDNAFGIPATPATAAIDVTTETGLRRAMREHPERADEWRRIAIQRGWAQPNRPPPPPPPVIPGNVPVAR
jgi:hypothetical protein